MAECYLEGCHKPAQRKKRSLCEKHYYRKYRYGSVHIVHKPGASGDKKWCVEGGIM